jgi:glycosyltransferase involved in cell wall biosynthesis
LLQNKGAQAAMNWCVVIPTYNNGKTLEKVIQDVLQVTGNVIVVNDGSTDNTSDILQKFASIKVISYSQNKGKGFALRKGFKRALQEGFTHAVTMDSDGQHYPSDIQQFVLKAVEYPDALIVGRRTLPQEKLRKGSGFANRFSNFWFRFITGINLPDTQSGFRLYPLELIRNMQFITRKYEFELEVLIRSAWQDIRIISIPVNVFYPVKEERISHYRPFTDFVRISLLNTVCVFIALFNIKPFRFLHYLKKESVIGFLRKHVLQTGDSMAKITLSVMFGVFMGIVPIWGYQLITAIALAHLFKLNKLIVIVAANISIPPMIPFILYLSYVTGGIIVSGENTLVFSHEITFAWVRDNLFQYIIGSMAFAVVAAVFFGFLTFVLLKVFRKKPVLIG